MIIRTENVKRCFHIAGKQSFYALKGINIDIPRGKLVILKGRSGSGKTTLLNILGALDQPTDGKVWFNDIMISDKKEKEREAIRRYDMGFVFQSVGLIPIMNAYENVDFGLRLADYKEDHRERINHVLELVGMLERSKHMPQEMSGGEAQRVAIARAIAHKPRIIFADEPTGALDTATGLGVMKVFRDLVEHEGTTILMTTHDTNLMELGDLVYEIEDGDIIGRTENIDKL